MAHVKQKKSKPGWKAVKIQPSYLAEHEGNELISLEVLTDYTFGKDGTVSLKKSKKTKKKKKTKKGKAKTLTTVEKGSDDDGPGDEEETQTKPKNKKSQSKARSASKEKQNVPHIEGDAIDEIVSVSNDDAEKGRKRNNKKSKLKAKRTSKLNQNAAKPVEDSPDEESNADESEDSTEESSSAPGPNKRKNDSDDSNSSKKKLKGSLSAADMSGWKDLFVPDVVLEALAEDRFGDPTPIQRMALPHAIRDKMDILGAAPTGSGKTLAFAIPLIHKILKAREFKNLPDQKSESDEEAESEEDGVETSGVASGDEATNAESDEDIAEDESDDDEIDDKSDDEEEDDEIDDESDDDEDDFDLPPDAEDEEMSDYGEDEVGCVAVKNNVSFPWLKNEATESPKPALRPSNPLQALILCPTRELAIQVKEHIEKAIRLTDIKVVAVVGGMSAQKQERLLKKSPEIVVATPGRLWELIQEGNVHLSTVCDIKTLVIDEADRMVEQGHFQELTKLLLLINKDEKKLNRRQTFVFSATLTMIHGGPDRSVHKKKKFIKTTEGKLGSLMQQIGMKDKPKVIDLTGKIGTAESLTEARINCTMEEKDLYLYYFLQQYPGRTLMFANSKDCIRRLMSIFTILQCSPLPLHADMHQKQRLKNLDKFKANSKGLLMATDVAARGLDIPDVQHVIHYQVPRTTENYVHRSGRTARAYKAGLSVVLIGPQDIKNYRKIIRMLNKDEDLPLFPTETDVLDKVKPAITLARQIDKEEHGVAKVKTQNDWFLKAAKDMDMEIDEEEFLEDTGDEFKQSQQRNKINRLRHELAYLISTPIRNRTSIGKYPTKSGKLVVPKSRDEMSAVSNVQKDHKNTKSLMDSVKPRIIKKRTPKSNRQIKKARGKPQNNN